MKINKIKINSYGKLKNKEIELKNNINIIQGNNEAGKSTLLNFIFSSFYGISKNKKGKEISDFDKYKPWVGEEFSGKLSYELDNKEKYEIFRDFKKKNPKIFNEKMEDISKEFNIDKNKGNEFFYEQTKIDDTLFTSTILVNQEEVKLENQEQNILIQKIANLVGTGEDKVSFKRAIDRIERRKLEEIGTERSREKPINLIGKNIKELEAEKQELEEYQNLKYEIEEKKKNLEKEIKNLENENNYLREIKLINENEKIENEKINLKINLKNQNDEKINSIKNKINEINSKNKNENKQNKKINSEKNKLNKIILIILFIIILINILQFIFIKNKILNYLLLLTVPVVLIFYLFFKNKIKNKELKNKKDLEKENSEINNLIQEINFIEKNNIELKKEIDELKNNFNLKIKNNYLNKIEKNKINYLSELKNINLEIQNTENKLSNKKIELHALEFDNKNIEPKLESLSKIEEKLVNEKEKMVNIKKLEQSINLAKEILNNSYEEMKNTVTPKFSEKLSQSIAQITNQKYSNINFNDEKGLLVELENGNYIPVSRLSIGTIDQLYLSLRLSMVEELSQEKMPIILDEVFAYYDTERLKNILKYISERFSNHQIIFLTCTNREKEILDELDIEYNFIKL